MSWLAQTVEVRCEELIDDLLVFVFFRNKLALTNEEVQDRVKEFEDLNVRLKDDLKDASQQLLSRGNELVKSKAELQSHRMEIDVSFLRGKFKCISEFQPDAGSCLETSEGGPPKNSIR